MQDSAGRTERHFWLQSPSPGYTESATPPQTMSACALSTDLDHKDHVCALDDSTIQLTDLVSRMMRIMNYN